MIQFLHPSLGRRNWSLTNLQTSFIWLTFQTKTHKGSHALHGKQPPRLSLTQPCNFIQTQQQIQPRRAAPFAFVNDSVHFLCSGESHSLTVCSLQVWLSLSLWLVAPPAGSSHAARPLSLWLRLHSFPGKTMSPSPAFCRPAWCWSQPQKSSCSSQWLPAPSRPAEARCCTPAVSKEEMV